MTECKICYDTYNGSSRKKCVCQYCQADYCRECVGNWLTSLLDEPRCPNELCKKGWSREYLDTVMTKVWRDGLYREYREKLLMDRERSLLPATQPRIEAINEAKRLEKEVVSAMRSRRKEIKAQIALLQAEEAGLQQQVWDLQNHCTRLREGTTDVHVEKQSKNFVRRCPADGCRGFLSTAWKCGVCELYSCADCHEVKGVARDSDHMCDPGNVETAKLLAKDTKPCPKCGEMITKIDGCDQMWCVSCHTAFSWKTGQVASGVVHNPHFYEWQRRQGGGAAPRVAGDIPCGGMPEFSDVRRAVHKRGAAYPGWLAILEMAHRRISHVQHVDITALARDGINVNDNIDLRIQYLLKEVDEPDMMSTLITREKKLEKDRELRRVYETLTAAGADIFRRLLLIGQEQGNDDERVFKPLIGELDELRKFINDALDSLRRRYTVTIHGFDESWDRLTLKKHQTKSETSTEIKTPYGLFVDAFDEWKRTYDKFDKKFSAEQNGRDLLNPYVKSLRKVKRLTNHFPTGNREVGRAADDLINYYEYDLRYYMYATGTLVPENQHPYYERQRNHLTPALSKWTTLIQTLSLTVEKEMNIIA